MYQSLITLRYAKALFLKAEEDQITDKVSGDIQKIKNTFRENPEIYKILQSPMILDSKKQKITREIFKEQVQDITLKFLLLILKNNRTPFLTSILRNFTDIYNEKEGIKTVELTTAIKIDDKEKSLIQDFIKDTFNAKKISFKEKTDKTLIGGFIIQIEDQLIDISVKKQLLNIKEELARKN